ncbi:MAG: deaminase [Chthonomonadaceae bacterium]|nr:deaminase [Chthonomonadaceae bacterium]
MKKTAIHAGSRVEGAPYSPGIAIGDFIFVSGQIPMKPDTKEVIRDDFEAATEQCILNIERILKAAESDLEHCVKVVVFLADMENFSRMNAVYTRYFGDVKPARSCVQVARLPLDVEVEIEAIAVKKG